MYLLPSEWRVGTKSDPVDTYRHTVTQAHIIQLTYDVGVMNSLASTDRGVDFLTQSVHQKTVDRTLTKYLT